MKRQLLFIQGGGKGAHDEWDDKLVDSLRRGLGQEVEIHYPRMPNEEDPSYPAWKTALQGALDVLSDGAILVAHSLGGAFLIKLLAERSPARVPGAIFLIATPFIGEGGWSADELRFPSDLGARLPGGVPIHLYQGLEDEVVPPSHIDLLAQALPQARLHRLPGRDHQLNDDLSEVAAEILSLQGQR